MAMQERIDRKAKTARYSFNSLAELARYIEETPKTWTRGNLSANYNNGSRAWDLRAGYAKAWDMARWGWPEGAQKAQRALKAYAPATPKPVERVDFYGHRPHVPRYCAGAPDSMIRHSRSETGSGKVLTLYVAVNATERVDADDMATYGLAMAHYINQLETDGVRVELHGAICSTVMGWRVAHTWKLKDAGQILDLAVVAFSVGHPAMFRRLGFALRERCAAPYTSGYGHSVDLARSDIINAPAGAKILNGMKDADTYARTPESALRHVTAQIEKGD